MTDDTLLLRAVLDNPREDAPRAQLADWLQENGETEFHRWYGRFIAAQLAKRTTVDIGHIWSDSLIGPAALHMKSFAFQLWDHWEDAKRPITYYRPGDYKSSAASPVDRTTLHFHRGFVRAVDCTIDEWLRLCLVLCKRHPIEEVRIRDFGFDSLDAARSPDVARGRWGIMRLMNIPHLRSAMRRDDPNFKIHYLPVGYKDLLWCGRLLNSYGDREYATKAEALADLSGASAQFGRNLERAQRTPSAPAFAE